MGQRDNPYDNAIIEFFNKSLKTGLLYENKTVTARSTELPFILIFIVFKL